MKNGVGHVIYVGKAKSLKSRVASYFNNSAKSPKTQILVQHINEFDFILTKTEAESLVLENNLIKEHRPKYNIRLKDDKSYPYVLLNYKEAFPRLEYVRRPKRKKGIELYGPFPVGSNISRILRVLTKAFELRDCSIHEFNSRKTPCILYQMKQCSAPCVDKIEKDKYLKDLDFALNFFRSNKKIKNVLDHLNARMMNLAAEEHFEQAAVLRDQIEELNVFAHKSFDQSVELLTDQNIDIISYHVGEVEIDISLYLIRHGNLLGHKNFHFLSADILQDIEDEVILAMLQYYSQNNELLPDKIVTSLNKEFVGEFETALGEITKKKIKISPGLKKYKSLLDSTKSHAEESQRVRIQNQDSVYVGLNKLKSLLNLPERPKLIECYDIAVWQGKSPTASQIVFYDGKADKTQYRYYHLEERPEGNNDFAMMEEVFTRRLKRGDLPDVFLVDGGVAQVNTVRKVLDLFNIEVPVIGIAKARDLKKLGFRSSETLNSEERLIIQGRSNPYILNKCPSLMRIAVQMRDEAHRFSRKLHHKAEHKRVIRSWIEDVKGLNDEIRQHVLRTNTLSQDDLKDLNIKELQDFLGINVKYARALYNYLHT
jgi:excinuclease ABC subunit C